MQTGFINLGLEEKEEALYILFKEKKDFTQQTSKIPEVISRISNNRLVYKVYRTQ